MKILASAVFEHVVYNVRLLDAASPNKVSLVVDALLRPGDADEGPLLVPLPELVAVIGDQAADRIVPDLRNRGRVVDHQGVAHVTFPFWTPVEDPA